LNGAIAQTLMNLGLVYRHQGQWQDAINVYEQSLQIRRDLDDRHGIAETLVNLGNVYIDQGRWEEARGNFEQSLQTLHDLGDRHGEGQTLANLGRLYEKRNQPNQSKTLWQQALTKLNPDSPDFQAVQQWIEELDAKNAKLRMGCGYGLLVGGIVAFLLVCLFKGQWVMVGFGLLVLGVLWARNLSHARIRKSHQSQQEG
jgi:tetratricopeptide (TPR) repeat protein